MNENDGGINQRPVRKKVRPDHLGITDGNYNDFIEEINSNATSSSSSTITEPPDADKKCDCIELLNLLLKKSDAIADHLIKLDVKINHLDSAPSNTRKVIKMGIVTMDQLKQFGLPAESVLDLENLDEKLKNDFEFKTKLVSNFTIFVNSFFAYPFYRMVYSQIYLTFEFYVLFLLVKMY